MEDWIKAAAQYGLAGFLILLGTAAVKYGLWPFIQKIVDSAQAAREKEHASFLEHLEKKDALIERIVDKHERITDKHTTALTVLTDEFKALRADLKK
jgi:hypothetical protein